MKIRETVTGKRFKGALAGATIAVFLGVTGLVTVYAQGAPGQISPNPLDAIVAKLDQVLAALNATPATTVVLSTPFLRASVTDHTHCAIANAGTAAFTYTFRTVTTGGATGAVESSGTLQPGRGDFESAGLGDFTLLRCEFRVTGAPASAVRANISILSAAGGAVASADAR